VSVRVRLVGDLRRFAESDAIEIEGGECSLAAAVDELVGRNPRLGKELFDEKGRLHYAVVLVASGRTATWPRDRDTLIADGEELLVTRFHAGG
jgi:molybdopterin converting factor small subunit